MILKVNMRIRKISLEKVERYRQITNIVIKYGFGMILGKLHLPHIRKMSLKKGVETLSFPQRIRLMCEELGPTFIKLCQILSTRPDLIPLSFVKEFEKLQDEVKPVETEEIKEIIQKELGDKFNDFFLSFEEKPLASASISQVHRAKIKGGEKIVLKIQRPGIEKIINADMEILYDISSLIEKFIPEARIYEPKRIVREFEKTMKRELNFLWEARSIKRFSHNFSGDSTVYIPKLYEDLTTEKILALEYIEGIKINNIEKIEGLGLDRKQIALNGAKAVLKQIFIDGFFHGDPHPGNVFVLENGKICYLDFGITGRISEERKMELISFFSGFLYKDSERILRTLILMNAIGEDIELKSLRREIEEMMDKYYDVSLKEMKIKEIVDEGFNLMRKYKVKIPSDFSLLTKSLIATEGVSIMLDPDFNLTLEIKPFIKEILKERVSFSYLTKNLKRTLSNLYFLGKETFNTLESFLRKGYFNIAFEHKGLNNLISAINKSSNRISFSLIISALLVGSSLIIISGKGPFLLGFPALGISGFILSAIFGLWLIFNILRNK